MVMVRDVMSDVPGASRSSLGRRSKEVLLADDSDAHATSLPREGQLLCNTPDASAEIWSLAVGSLSSTALKFILNAATDTLPHNSNLSLWGRPDIVVWEENIKSVYLIELTVCFETNFDEARQGKICQYTELCEEAEDRGYTCSILTIEVGSRGVVNIAGIESLLHVGKKQWTSFLINLSKTVESHRIWLAQNWQGQSENIHDIVP